MVWVPPVYGDAVACISDDGTLSLWEEVVEGNCLISQLLLLHIYVEVEKNSLSETIVCLITHMLIFHEE